MEKKYTIVGIDEAGRGPLAGPVVAASVIIDEKLLPEGINDSKKVSEKNRNIFYQIILKNASQYGVGIVSPLEIDEINILNASILAMHKSISALKVQPDFIAVDGNRFKPYNDVAFHCQVKGDATYMNIAAASILAKTYRDDKMRELAIAYPQYGWERNAGYPTKGHRAAIRSHGPTPHHRMTFRLLPSQLDLFDL